VPHLEPYPHHRSPLDIVGLGERRLLTVGTDVPDNGLDPMVTMVPVRGGRATPPVKAVIFINPSTGASTPVWAAATVPLGVHGCPLYHLLSHYLPHQLGLVSVVVCRNRAAGASAPLLLLLLPLLLSVPPSLALPPLSPSLQPLSSLAHVPLLRQPRPPAGAAHSRRTSTETVLQTWCTSGGCYMGKRLPQMSYCSSV
jgi:hypothetical protein